MTIDAGSGASAEQSEFLSDIIQTQNDLAAVELNAQTIMQTVAARTQKLTAADGASVQLIDQDRLIVRAATGFMEGRLGFSFSIDASLTGHAVRTGESQYCADAEVEDARVDHAACRALGIRSFIVVPLFYGPRAIGVMNVVCVRPHAFKPHHVSGLRLMAGLVAAALAHAEEFQTKKTLLAERTQTLHSLQESEERFRSAFDQAAIGKALVSLDGRFLQVNRSLSEIVGYSETELLAVTFQQITHPDDLQADLVQLQRLVAGEIRRYQMVKRYYHKHGHIVWVLLSVSLVRAESGKPLYAISQIQDITDRKETEEALRASEEAHRRTFELAGVGMAHTDLASGRFLRVNRKLCEITGYAEEEMRSVTFAQITHPDDRSVGLESAGRMAERKAGHYAAEKRYIHKDGHVVWVEMNATVIPDPGGEPLYAVATFNDITKRKRAEDALRSSERQFRTLAAHAPVGIFQCDAAGNNVFVNDRWCVMTGMSAAQAHGAGWLSALHPEDRERVSAAWQHAAATGSEFAGEYRYLTDARKITWMHGAAVPMRDDTGRVTGFLGTATDVTEQKRSEWLESDRREVLELVAQDGPLKDVLDRLVRVVDRQVEDCMTGVIVLQGGEMMLHAPGLAPAMLEKMNVRLPSLAYALAEKMWSDPSVIDITTMTMDPIWQGLQPEVIAEGLRSCWMLPIASNDGTSLGMITVFCRHQRNPSAPESDMLTMVSRLATISIEHHNTTVRLDHQVRHDALTRLPNRLLFEDRLHHAMTLSRRSAKPTGVMLMDIDKFKSINDTFGHQAGDDLLQKFAQRLKACLRETDTMARLGGDEFAIVLPELTSREGAAAVAQKLVESLNEPFDLGGQILRVTCSIGIAVFPQDADDAMGIQKKADATLYRVKERGRNGFAFSD